VRPQGRFNARLIAFAAFRLPRLPQRQRASWGFLRRSSPGRGGLFYARVRRERFLSLYRPRFLGHRIEAYAA